MDVYKILLLSFLKSCWTAPIDNTVGASVDIDVTSLTFLKDKGYLQAFDKNIGQIQSQKSIQDAIRRFQAYANLKVTGEMDTETKTYMKLPRCGMPDITQHSSVKRKRRFTKQGTHWRNTTITWALENNNDDGIPFQTVRDVMQKSFKKWHDVSPLTFIELVNKPKNTAQIRVLFTRGTHGDPYPFDGRGGTLAHAFYPHNNAGLSGDVHFDDDEVYTAKSNEDRTKRKLLWVAVHELGHSIGLEHSSIKGAVMYPWYQHFEGSDFDLTYDDISGIQNIYGSPPASRTTTTTTKKGVTLVTKPPTKSTASTPRSKVCTERVGAALLGKDNKIYMMNKDKLYILNREQDGMGIKEGPKPVSDVFDSVTSVDAVFRRPSDKAIVLFHGDKFSVYSSTKLIYKDRKISDGFQKLENGFSNVDAAFVLSLNQKLYIFKGENYYRFSILSNNDYILDNGYPQRISSKWRGLPSSVDAVFEWSNKQIYFFKDQYYYRWDKRRFQVERGYPLKTSESFLRCSNSLRTQKLTDSKAASGVKNLSTVYTTVFLLIVVYILKA